MGVRVRVPPSPPASGSVLFGDAGAGSVGEVKVISGRNPQIAKADGDALVRAYIAAMPGWFVSCHVFTGYVKVTPLDVASLDPVLADSSDF
ncbi:MAG: hypothetical protein F4X64_16825 [Chloroflexi bacterium]|nr:hypothetical protein [Chloroflexota bacterium]